MNISEWEILEFLKRYVTAANSRNFVNIADIVHPDALFRFAEGDFAGIDNIREAFESAWADTVVDENYSLMDARIVTSDSQSAVVAYSFKRSGIENGRPFRITGRGTNVIVQNGEKLQCIYEHLGR